MKTTIDLWNYYFWEKSLKRGVDNSLAGLTLNIKNLEFWQIELIKKTL